MNNIAYIIVDIYHHSAMNITLTFYMNRPKSLEIYLITSWIMNICIYLYFYLCLYVLSIDYEMMQITIEIDLIETTSIYIQMQQIQRNMNLATIYYVIFSSIYFISIYMPTYIFIIFRHISRILYLPKLHNFRGENIWIII